MSLHWFFLSVNNDNWALIGKTSNELNRCFFLYPFFTLDIKTTNCDEFSINTFQHVFVLIRLPVFTNEIKKKNDDIKHNKFCVLGSFGSRFFVFFLFYFFFCRTERKIEETVLALRCVNTVCGFM